MAMTIGGASSAASMWTASRPSGAAAATDEAKPNRYMASLTAADRELVFQATGTKVDESSHLVPMFAVAIGVERQAGGLAGREVDVSFLQGMRDAYSGSAEGKNWIPTLDRALSYLRTNQSGSGHIDVRA